MLSLCQFHMYVCGYLCLNLLFEDVASAEESRLLIGWMALRRLRLKQINKQGNYSLRRPLKLIIPQAVIAIEQKWATV